MNLIILIYNLPDILKDVQHYRVEELLVSKIKIIYYYKILINKINHWYWIIGILISMLKDWNKELSKTLI